jgi:aryl-alcohol dehydrogenase-like predicted oxidoreductase
VVHRRLGRSGLSVSPLGYGAFKIGRNQGIKYAQGYELPDEAGVDRLLNAVLDLGINYIDTAPAYGLSEQRIGRTLGHRRRQYVLSTKVGETFLDGRSTYDFTARGVRSSVERSLRRLDADVLDLVFIHSDGSDLEILERTDAVPTLEALRSKGHVRAIGLSAKTVEGARAALSWSDAVMVEYHLDDPSFAPVIAEAAAADVGVVVKKGLASGRLEPSEAVRFALDTPGVGSLVVGSLNLDHLRENVRAADA